MSRMKELYQAIVDAAATVGISTDCALTFLDELGLFNEEKMKRLEVVAANIIDDIEDDEDE